MKPSRFLRDEFSVHVGDFLRALCDRFTYSPHRNVYLLFGVLWGLPIPILSLTTHLLVADLPFNAAEIGRALQTQPVHYLFLFHPLIFGIVFGSLGTIRHWNNDQINDLIAGLEHKVRERTEQLGNVHLQALRALATTIEMKDPYTRGHCSRVATIGMAIAEELGNFDPEFRETLLAASYLHDIGKIWVPREVLGKSKALSEVEWQMVEQHPEKGAEVLRTIERFDRVAEIVAQHHERMDGSGYPRGMKGDEILQEAKILMVSDAYDALTTARPYRIAFPPEVAREELRRSAGLSHDVTVLEDRLPATRGEALFDRGIVSALCNTINQLPAAEPAEEPGTRTRRDGLNEMGSEDALSSKTISEADLMAATQEPPPGSYAASPSAQKD